MRQYTTGSIVSNRLIATGIYDMTLTFDKDLSDARAGQFAQIFVPRGELLLPRPISLCGIDREKGTLRVVYQVVGKGTDYFSKLQIGDPLRILAPLGNGFAIFPKKKRVAIAGGGVGVPPMLELAKELKTKAPDVEISVFLGFRSEPFLIQDFAALGVKLHVATDDGSVGFKGNVIALMESLGYSADVVYGCGPKIMLKSLNQWADANGAMCFVSMEERMACGLGACAGCAIPVKDRKGDDWHYKKVCKEGPVFKGSEVIWDA